MTVSNNPLNPNPQQNVQSSTIWSWLMSQFSTSQPPTQATQNPYTPGSQAYYAYQQQQASGLFGGNAQQSCFPPTSLPVSGQPAQSWQWMQWMLQKFPFMQQFFGYFGMPFFPPAQPPLEPTNLRTPDPKTGKITFNLTKKDDTVTAGQEYSLTGMKYFLVVNGEKFYVSDPNLVEINGLAGHDNINVSSWYANGVRIDGGLGNDTISGTQGNDVIDGGQGSDTLIGNWGDDQIIANKDGGLWFYSQNKDTVDGGGGVDHVVHNHNDIVTNAETTKKSF